MSGIRRLTVVMDVDVGRATASLGTASAAVRRFSLDTQRSSDSIRHMGRSFDSFGSGMQRPLHTLRDYVLVLGNLRFALMNVRDLAVGWVWGLMKQAGELERLTILMRGFSKATTEAGKTEEAQRNLQNLMNMARQTGFEVKTLADSFVKFQSADLDPTTYSLRGLTEAVAKFGGNSDVMHRASIAIQQMAGKGKISMEELRQQLGEAVPSAMAIMAKSLGVTVEKLGDEIKKGHVKAKPALELMLRDMEMQFGGSGKKLAETFFGQLAQVKTNMMQLAADFTAMGNEKGMFAGAKQSLAELNAMMRSGEGRAAMADLGNSIASIASALASGIKWVVEYRNEIGTLVQMLATMWVVSKGAQVFGWMASMGMTAAQALRNIGNSAIQNTGHLAVMTRESQALTASIDRQRVASELWMQRAQASLATAQQTVVSTQQRIMSLEGLNQTYAQNITMLQAQQRQERANLSTAQSLHAANLATGRSGTQSAMMVKAAQDQLNATTRSLISQQRLLRASTADLAAANAQLAAAENAVTAATARVSLAERANAISKGFLATVSRAAAGSIALLTAALNAESGAAARATLVERANAVSKGLMTTAARAAGAAATFMGRACSIALGPVGMIGLAAYTAGQYFGFFSSKANEAADAARNLAGSMASLENIKQIQAGIDEIDKTLAGDDKDWTRRTGRGLLSWGGITESREAMLKRREGLVRSMGNSQNAYANRGRDYVGAVNYNVQNDMDRLRAKASMDIANRNLDARIAAGDKAALAERNRITNGLVAEERRITQNLLTQNQRRLRAAERRGDRNAIADYSARVVGLEDKLKGLNQAGDAAALQMEAFGGTGRGSGGGAAAGRLANNVGNLTGSIAGLEAKLNGDVSTKLIEFEAKLKAGGFKGKTAKEIELERRKAALEDAVADGKRAQKGENSYESLLGQMTGRLAELNDELIGGEGNLAKFDARVKAGVYSELRGDQIEKLRAVAEALDEAEKNLRLKELDKDLTKATAEADAMWSNFNTGAMIAQKRLAGLRAGFEDKLIGLTGTQLDEAKAKIEQIVAKLNEAEAAKLMQGWMNDTASNNESLMGENAAREAAFQRELSQRQLQLDSFLMQEGIHIDRKKEMIRAFNEWQISERKKVDRANETQMMKQLRDWANLGQSLQQVMTGAMSKFVDGLAEGRLAFKDFAKDLLKQLLKIIIQAMVAYAIMSALGMAPQGAGGKPMGFMDFMKNNIAQGFGGGQDVQWGKNHHGGYVGDGRSTVSVSSMMLGMASKYHTGGGITKLGPKEVPLIGLEGERVLNEEQQRQLGRDMAEGRSSKAPPVTVQIINNGEPVTAEAGPPEFDGKEYVIGVVLDQLNKQGRLRDSVAAIGARK